jgi:hypothetical protein
MSYQKDRDEFLTIMSSEGMSLDTARKLLRYSQTLHRLATAQCNGDYPADNGERKVESCHKCDSGFVPSSMVRYFYSEMLHAWEHKPSKLSSVAWEPVKICPDCRTQDLVDRALPVGFKAVFAGDSRGCVFKLQVPSGRTNDWGKEGICVPVRDR